MIKVIVYSSPTCHYCKKVKDWLKRKKISFEDKNARADEQAKQEVLKKTGDTLLPVIIIKKKKEKILIGWDPDELETAFQK